MLLLLALQVMTNYGYTKEIIIKFDKTIKPKN